MGQQLVDAAVEVIGSPCEDVLEVCPRVVAVHPGGLHQAHDNDSALSDEFAAGKQLGLSSHSPGTHEIFKRVVVDGNVAIDQIRG